MRWVMLVLIVGRWQSRCETSTRFPSYVSFCPHKVQVWSRNERQRCVISEVAGHERHVPERGSIVEDALSGSFQIVPPDPCLNRRRIEVVENVRWQLDVASASVQFEHVVCGGGGLGIKRRQRGEQPSRNEQN